MSLLVKKLNRMMRSGAASFRRDADVLEAMDAVLEARHALRTDTLSKVAPSRALVQAATQRLHARFRASGKGSTLARVAMTARLARVEVEILLALSLRSIGLGPHGARRVSDVDDLQTLLAVGPADAMTIMRALSPAGRLVRSGLVHVRPQGLPHECEIELSEDVTASLVQSTDTEAKMWAVRSHDELLDRCRILVTALQQRGDNLRDERRGMPIAGRARQASSRVRRLLGGLHSVLERHPEWPLAAIAQELGGPRETLAFIALLGVELGHVPVRDELATGSGLAEALSSDVTQVRHHLPVLRAEGRLRSGGFARIADGPVKGTGQEDDTLLAECRFELSRDVLSRLGLSARGLRRAGLRTPRIRLDQLVLAPHVENALRLAIVQVRDQRVLVEQWGFGGALNGGRATTLLFWGPPGVGKTASAEALAHELGKPLLVVDHAQLQSAWVGETEKNMARVFRDAMEADAVLLLDEADAFLMNRDNAEKSWEIRWTNTLLQEIERFEGVLVLATNRQPSLDPALARRIALKVGFDRPHPQDSLRLWGSLIPRELPLAEDVDLEEFAAVALSGGEIRNAVLNAARLALLRGARARVTMQDLRTAVSLEKGERSAARLGFG